MNILLGNDIESLSMTKSRTEITTGKLCMLSFEKKVLARSKKMHSFTEINTVM